MRPFIFIAVYRFFSCGMKDLSSLTRNQTQAPALGVLATGPPRSSLLLLILIYHKVVILLVILHGNPLQYSCLEDPHGQRSLGDYSPWGCKESDATERLSTAQHVSLRKRKVKIIFSFMICLSK